MENHSQKLIYEAAVIIEQLRCLPSSITALSLISEFFRDYPKVQRHVLHGLVESEDEVSIELFASVFELAHEALLEEAGCSKTIANSVIDNSRYHLLRFLTEKAPDILMIQDKDGECPLYKLAAKPKDFEHFLAVVESNPLMLDLFTNYDESMAHAAARSGNMKAIELIAELAPHLFLKIDTNQSTPLDEAARGEGEENIEVLKLIAKVVKETLSWRNRWQWTPITTAANGNNSVALEFFAQNFPDLVLQEFSETMKRIKIHSYQDCENILRKYFPEKF